MVHLGGEGVDGAAAGRRTWGRGVDLCWGGGSMGCAGGAGRCIVIWGADDVDGKSGLEGTFGSEGFGGLGGRRWTFGDLSRICRGRVDITVACGVPRRVVVV